MTELTAEIIILLAAGTLLTFGFGYAIAHIIQSKKVNALELVAAKV